MNRKTFLKKTILSSAGIIVGPGMIKNPIYGSVKEKEFIHPGILHTNSDLERIRNYVRKEEFPPMGSYNVLKNMETSSSSYHINGPFPYIARDGVNAHTKTPTEHDFNAAYRNALMWIITGNEAHAEKSIEIINAYSDTLKGITGSNDNALTAALGGFILVNAAEIIRYTYKEWKKGDIERCENMFRQVFYEGYGLVGSFFNRPAYTNGNWGNAAIKATMGFGVFLNDRKIFKRAVDLYYSKGKINGSLANYIINKTGQCQESGRDQPHCMLGLGNLAAACEVGYNQGLDMYGAMDNRLMAGYEYVSKYNLGHSVPYVEWKDVTRKYSHWTVISPKARGQFRPIFEIAYNHYVNRKGLKMPWTDKVLAKIRPEGAPPWADEVGFGTLLFYLGKTHSNSDSVDQN